VKEEGCAEEDGEDGGGGDRGAVTPLIRRVGESWGLLAVKSEDGSGNERRHFERPILMDRELLSSNGKIYGAGRVCYETVRSDEDRICQVLGRVRRGEPQRS
jgi:hypothetical protein